MSVIIATTAYNEKMPHGPEISAKRAGWHFCVQKRADHLQKVGILPFEMVSILTFPVDLDVQILTGLDN